MSILVYIYFLIIKKFQSLLYIYIYSYSVDKKTLLLHHIYLPIITDSKLPKKKSFTQVKYIWKAIIEKNIWNFEMHILVLNEGNN